MDVNKQTGRPATEQARSSKRRRVLYFAGRHAAAHERFRGAIARDPYAGKRKTEKGNAVPRSKKAGLVHIEETKSSELKRIKYSKNRGGDLFRPL